MYAKNLLTSTSIAALATLFAVSAPANAADVYDGRTPSDAYVQDGPEPGNWSGGFVGGALGYGAANYELSGPGFNFDGISGRGVQGCGIIGAQQQAGVFVVGAEGRGCLAEISTDLTVGPAEASLELDHSYSLYAKAGVAHGSVLTSLLGGYRWQHYEASAPGFSFDDTIGGLSGGLLIEKKLDAAGRWNLGLEGIFTQFEEQDAAILNIDPSLFESNLRLTYTFGY
jgi:hypothetical protein